MHGNMEAKAVRQKCKAVLKNRTVLKLFYYSGFYKLLDLIFDQKGVYILCYHRLTDRDAGSGANPMTVDYRRFEQHLAFLKKRYVFLSLEQAVGLLNQKKKLKRSYLVVTFDDGYRDNFLYGRELFRRFALKPTIFLPVGNIDRRTWLWHDQIDYLVFACSRKSVLIETAGIMGNFPVDTDQEKRILAETIKESVKREDEAAKERILEELSVTFGVNVPERCGELMDWKEVCSLLEVGADMGGHTMSHPILSHLTEEAMKEEISACRRMIEDHTGAAISSFAYPNGKDRDYTEKTVMEVMRHYRCAVTTVNGVNKPGVDPYKLHRILIGNDPDVLMLRFRLLQAKLAGKPGRVPKGWNNSGSVRANYSPNLFGGG